jgi:hypothetical protein
MSMLALAAALAAATLAAATLAAALASSVTPTVASSTLATAVTPSTLAAAFALSATNCAHTGWPPSPHTHRSHVCRSPPPHTERSSPLLCVQANIDQVLKLTRIGGHESFKLADMDVPGWFQYSESKYLADRMMDDIFLTVRIHRCQPLPSMVLLAPLSCSQLPSPPS